MHDYSICFKIAPKVSRAVPFLPLLPVSLYCEALEVVCACMSGRRQTPYL